MSLLMALGFVGPVRSFTKRRKACGKRCNDGASDNRMIQMSLRISRKLFNRLSLNFQRGADPG
jgi:hypothetical protein